MTKGDIEKYWNQMPWNILSPSFRVDLCQFLGGVKPAVRTRIKDINNIQVFLKSISGIGWHTVFDKGGFFIISNNKELSRNIMDVDHSPPPHANKLGHLLGYPKCCSVFIESIGENEIDKTAERYTRNYLKDAFFLLDISQYLRGIALISHVPCSYECEASLAIAQKTLSIVKEYSYVNGFNDWALSLIYYFRERLD